MRYAGTTGTRTGRTLAVLALACVLPLASATAGDLDEARKAMGEMRLSFDSAGLPVRGLPALSGQPLPRPALRTVTQDRGFMARHLMPRVSQQLGRMAPIHALDVERTDWQRSGLHDWFSGTASHYAGRGVRKAAREYLVEETAVGTFLDSLRVGGHQPSAAAGGPEMTDYGVRLSHGRPSVELRHRSTAGTTRFGVGLDGSLRLEFRPSGSGNGRLTAGYDAREARYSVAFRHSY